MTIWLRCKECGYTWSGNYDDPVIPCPRCGSRELEVIW